MSTMRITSAALLFLVAARSVQAQYAPTPPPPMSPYNVAPPRAFSLPAAGTPSALPPTNLPSSPSAALVDTTQPSSPSAASWLSSPCYCCSPVGGNGPISAELFLFTGPTIPAGGGSLNPRVNTGWMTEWGGRSLFFNTAGDAAWTAMFGISYQYNSGDETSPTFPFFRIAVVPRDLHRWAVGMTGGRDWCLYRANEEGGLGKNLRFGFDIGGRWGTSHINLLQANNPDPKTNYLRRQDVFRSLVLGSHVDFEVPMGGWVWFGGLRAEYVFNWWTDLLPGMDNRLNDMNLLLSTGFRY